MAGRAARRLWRNAAEPRAWGELAKIATLPDIARLRVDLTKVTP